MTMRDMTHVRCVYVRDMTRARCVYKRHDLNLDVARTKVRNDAGEIVKLVNGEYVELGANETYQESGPLGFAVLGRVHFKQLNIDGLKLSATPDSTPQTLISAITIQNADIQANLTATPIR